MNGTRIALLYSFAEKYVLLAAGTAATMVLSRVLTPAETGVFSVCAVLVGMAQVVRDFGVGQYVIQRRDLDTPTLRAVLGVNWLLGAALAMLIVAVSVPVARFYHDARIARALQVLAANFLLIPFTAVTLPLLRRQMRFRAVCAINLAGGLCGACVSVGLALTGHGYISLAWGALAGSAAGALASVPVRPSAMPWRPSLRGARQVLAYGSYATAGTLVDEAGVAAPDLIIGKMIGMEGAGLFGKAQSLLAVFRTAVGAAVTPVMLPLLAARSREPGGADAVFLAAVGNLTACAWPFFAFAAVAARPLVRALYGDQWDKAVDLIRILCIATALISMCTMARYLFIAGGHVKLQARLDVLASCARIGLLLVAAGMGLAAAAWAVVVAALVRTWLTLRYLDRACGVGAQRVLRACAPSAVLAAGCAAATALALIFIPGVAGLPAACAAASLAWFGLAAVLRHPLSDEIRWVLRRLAALRI